jgi:predicted nucleotidyltransferase
MTRTEIISIIAEYFSQQPVEWVGIFGSFAGGDMHQESDVDLAIQFKAGAKVNLLDYVGYKQDLEQLLERKVDLVTYKYLRARLKDYIDRDLQIIFGNAA